jgi:hypothetical protein
MGASHGNLPHVGNTSLGNLREVSMGGSHNTKENNVLEMELFPSSVARWETGPLERAKTSTGHPAQKICFGIHDQILVSS